MLRSDDSETDMHNRISMVMEGVQCIGTVARISTSGLCVSCTHVCVSDGRLIELTAFGGETMKLIASFPSYDIIFLRGKEGSICSSVIV